MKAATLEKQGLENLKVIDAEKPKISDHDVLINVKKWIPERNVFKIPDDVEWDMAASLPVTGLTPYHALKEASLKINEYLLVFGASRNTGIMAVQIGKRMGAKVIAVSKDEWIRKDFGADYIVKDFDKVN